MDYNIRTLESATTLTLVRLDQLETIMTMDSKVLTTNCRKFMKANHLAYYVLINTWGHQILEFSSEEAWVYIWMRIQKAGLISVIRDAVSLSDLLIHGEAPDWDYTYGYLSVLSRKGFFSDPEELRQLLQILRYPKRFSPLYADKIKSDSLHEFLTLNTRVKRQNQSEPSWFWTSRIKSRISLMLKGISINFDNGYFSSGTSSVTGRLFVDKLREYSLVESNLYHSPLYPISFKNEDCPRYKDTDRLRDSVVVEAVPKSYKSARIIAKEPPYHAYYLQAASRAVREAVSKNGYDKYVNVLSQQENQDLCLLGSIDGSYATIDLSSASDTISENFARSVLPSDFLHAVDRHRPMYMDVEGKRRIIQMFATSGSPLTFICESVIFTAIALEVTDFCHVITKQKMLPPRVYGDDIIIDDRCCETMCDVLTLLGFIPNISKSFFGKSTVGFYRESCGVEYLNGAPMHSCYFPRKPIDASPEGLASICDLQHRLFTSWRVRMFLSELVTLLEPRMTCHVPFTDCSDLWDIVPHFKEINIDKIGGSPHGLRELYLTPKAKYKTASIPTDMKQALDLWYYCQYLRFGPLYLEDEDEQFLVSTSRKHYVADCNRPDIVWDYTQE